MALKIGKNSKVVGANDDNIIWFESDEDFENFCLTGNRVIKVTDAGTETWAYEFTPEYEEAVAQGKKFCIKDRNSKVAERGVVGAFTKVENLIPYTGR